MKINLWIIRNVDEFNRFVIMGGKIIIIKEDPDPYLKANPSAIMGTILLPSYNVISAEIDENYAEADHIYFEELQREESDGYLISILAALYSGISIGLYFGTEEFDMRFVKTFLQYIYQAYGMVPGLENVVPMIEPIYDQANLDKIYYFGLISFEKYIQVSPGISNNPSVISKMVHDTKPAVEDYNLKTIINFFVQLKNDVMKFGSYKPYPLTKEPGERSSSAFMEDY